MIMPLFSRNTKKIKRKLRRIRRNPPEANPIDIRKPSNKSYPIRNSSNLKYRFSLMKLGIAATILRRGKNHLYDSNKNIQWDLQQLRKIRTKSRRTYYHSRKQSSLGLTGKIMSFLKLDFRNPKRKNKNFPLTKE
jgi:hypothetical protein